MQNQRNDNLTPSERQALNLAPDPNAWPPFGWLTKDATAARLKIGPSRVHGLGAEGKIKTAPSRNPKSGQTVTLYHEGDVEREVWQRENPPTVSLGPDAAAVESALLAKRTPVTSNSGLVLRQTYDQIRGDHERGQIGPQHSTEHYWIKEWIKPSPDSPHHKFIIAGPGTVPGRAYIALTESCGPHHIQALEAAYQAGLAAGELAPRRALWITVGEAAEYTGLPASAILKLIQSGCLPAFNVGPRPGGAWRIARAALDELKGDR